MSTTHLQLFQSAVMQSWNAIVITGADLAAGGRVEIANPAFCTMTGYSLDELRGRTLKMLQGPDTDPAVIDHLRACLREARFFEGTTTNYRKDGSSYIVRWNISPVRDEDGVLTHFISVQQDISEYVRTERENRLLARAQAAAIDLAERIRMRVAAYRDAEIGKVTLSLGLATLSPAESTDELLARADAALYQAKRGGRDRLCVAEPGG